MSLEEKFGAFIDRHPFVAVVIAIGFVLVALAALFVWEECSR